MKQRGFFIVAIAVLVMVAIDEYQVSNAVEGAVIVKNNKQANPKDAETAQLGKHLAPSAKASNGKVKTKKDKNPNADPRPSMKVQLKSGVKTPNKPVDVRGKAKRKHGPIAAQKKIAAKVNIKKHTKEMKKKYSKLADIDAVIKKSEMNGASSIQRLCQIINFINDLLGINFLRDFCNLILQPPIVVTTTAVADDPQTTKTTELTSTTLEEKSTTRGTNDSTTVKPINTTVQQTSPKIPINVTFIPLTSTTNKAPLTLTTPRIPIITNQSTTGIPMITNQTTPEIPRTTANQTTTTTNSSLSVISYTALDGEDAYISCDHVPGTINIISASYGPKNLTSERTDVRQFLTQETIGKTTFIIVVRSLYFDIKFKNFSNILSVTYTCSQITLGSTKVIDSFEGTRSILSCPASSVINVQSAFYEFADPIACPRVSVIADPVIRAAHGASTYSFAIANTISLNFSCSSSPPANSWNKMSISYSCQNTTYYSAVAREFGRLILSCPPGTFINVSRAMIQSLEDPSCNIDTTSYMLSMVPWPSTTEFSVVHYFVFDNCAIGDYMNVNTVNYTCFPKFQNETESTSVSIRSNPLVIKCSPSQTIHLVSSRYYCVSNSSQSISNPDIVMSRCEGKKELCSFGVDIYNLLNSMIPFFDQSCPIYESAALSVTYTCIN